MNENTSKDRIDGAGFWDIEGCFVHYIRLMVLVQPVSVGQGARPKRVSIAA